MWSGWGDMPKVVKTVPCEKIANISATVGPICLISAPLESPQKTELDDLKNEQKPAKTSTDIFGPGGSRAWEKCVTCTEKSGF